LWSFSEEKATNNTIALYGKWKRNGMDIPRAHLSVENVEDGYAECDVRLTAGHKK